jgi:5-methylcytosine-specific restriction endonuclease McrA
MNNMSDWKEINVSRLALPQGYERHGITFASLRAADLFDLMKDLQWHTKEEIRAHLGREENRAALRDLRQSGFVIDRTSTGKGDGTNQWRLHSLTQDPRLLRLRSSITPRMEHNIFERDGYKCVLCGATADIARLVVDHRVPIDRKSDRTYIRKPGWSAHLQTLCKPCNDGKRQECAYCKIGPRKYRKNCEDCHLAYPERHAFISAAIDAKLRDAVRTFADELRVSVDEIIERALHDYLH